MKNKGVAICLAAVMALSAVGFGFAKWSESVEAKVSPNTGSLKLGWVPFSAAPLWDRDQASKTPDWHASQDLDTTFEDFEKKDVGATSVQLKDTNSDTYLDLMEVTIDNAYPFYYNEISGKIKNYGSIPMIIQKPTLHWKSPTTGAMTERQIEDGYVYWLGRDGRIIGPYAPGFSGNDPELSGLINTPVQVGQNWVLELRWMDNADKQLHPGPMLEESFEFQVLQAAAQKASYSFGISVEGIQWNEIR